MRNSLVLLTCCLLAPCAARADKRPKPPAIAATAEKLPWKIDDVLLAEKARDFQISPDGKWAAWVKLARDEDAGEEVGHVFRTSLSERRATQMTRGPDTCRQPRWSPDGKRLAFLSARPPHKAPDGGDAEDKPKEQIWLMDPLGGEPWRLTELDREVTAFAWAGADAIVFAAREAPTFREKLVKDEREDTSVVVDDEKHEPPVRLFKVAIESGKVARLTDNPDRIQSLALSPDGRWAVTIHGRSLRYEYDQQVKPVVRLHDLKKGENKQVFKGPRRNVATVVWAPDGKGFYATNLYTTHPRYVLATVTKLYYHDLASGAEREIDLDWQHGLANQNENDYRAGIVPTSDGFLALLADGVRHRLARYRRAGDDWKREWLEGEHADNVFALQASADGKTVLYAYSKADTPTQWYCARLEGDKLTDPVAVTDLNEHFQELPRSKAEAVRWKGSLDEEVEGILYYPHGYKEGKKYPLVVMIHGGPFGADFDSWDESWAYPTNLVTQRGAFVLKPNYHGSSNYGLKFAESIAGGKYYDLPLEDIEKGVDALIARGLVDAERIGTLGWSNGSILSVALVCRNPRYKAASLGAGGAEWVGDWGACEMGHSFSNYYFGKAPWEDPQLYVKLAPLYQFDKVRTPCIIFQGDKDRTVPAHHAWSQYRTLQAIGKAPARLVLFPEEEHSLAKLVHQRRKLEEELHWFDKHLFKTAKEEDLALKPGSPLARALALKGAKRDGRRYGEMVKGVLVPETVEYQGDAVGRFEVTAAQYAQFDKHYKAESGKENHAAAGITFEQARAYCKWLSEQTGQTYRLPDEEEAETLYDETDGKDENTLDHWAGYAVNPDDAARLREKLKELGEGAPLLSEVGKFRGLGDGLMVFDLGGNAAEWVVTKDGKGRAAGGCAALAADVKQSSRKPPPEYVGFRVVKERGEEKQQPTPGNGQSRSRRHPPVIR